MRGLNCPFFFFFFSFFHFFSLFLVFFLGAFYYKNTMDEHRHKILVVLVYTMAIHQVIAQVVSLQRVIITQHWSIMSVLFFSKFVDMPPRVQSIWRYERAFRYMKNQLFGSFLEKMFSQHTRLSFDTFRALIKVVGPSLE